jgi:hypothetical protein
MRISLVFLSVPVLSATDLLATLQVVVGHNYRKESAAWKEPCSPQSARGT